MKYNTLNQTDIKVSEICLGTMTYGMQNDKKDAFQQLDYATDNGINFIDTAELYSIPAVNFETFGRTEEYIGKWIKHKKNRDKLVLSTKVLGPTTGSIIKQSRPNPNPLTKDTINEALNKSLIRLYTDYIDLYQIHWPLRPTNYFGHLNYTHVEVSFDIQAQILDTIVTMNDLIKQGKIRHYGLSNETAWGVMTFIRLACENNLIAPITVQNPYSLLNRSYEVGLAEVSMHENVGLLAYSPLACGALSGKHVNGVQKNTRVSLYPEYFTRYTNPQALLATKAYHDLSLEVGIELTHMALAFINKQPFLTSNIIGATKMNQLEQCITSINTELSPDIMQNIEEIHILYPFPAP